MRLIQLFGTNIYFDGIRISVNVNRIYVTFKDKIYAKYILFVQLFAKIYFIYFDIYVTYEYHFCKFVCIYLYIEFIYRVYMRSVSLPT